jgi:ketosteroid isomerase-like protein
MDSAGDQDLAMVLQFRDAPGFDETAARNRETLIAALGRIEAGDFAAFWDIFDPDVTFHEAACLPYGGAHRGLEATQRAYASLCACYSDMHSTMEAVLASRDLCILYQTITFRVAANGQGGTLPVCEIFRFRDGRVTEWRACYFDADFVARALAGA